MNKDKRITQNASMRPLVPRLRFPEFAEDGEWKGVSLQTICNVLQGYGFPEKYQGRSSGDYPFFKVSDISNSLNSGKHCICLAINFIDAERLYEIGAKLIPVGSTIFAKIGEALKLNRRAITAVPCLIDNNVAAVKAIYGKTQDVFLFYTMSKVNLGLYAGGAVPSVNKSSIENIEITIPTLPEQQRIADCLTSLDENITAQSHRLDTLKAHKKGLMQKLFPAEGRKVPELRFPKFVGDGEWEVKKILHIATILKGKGISKSDVVANGNTPCIRYGELYTHYTEVIDKIFSKTNLPSSDLFFSRKNDIIIPSSGETKIDIATASCVMFDDIALGSDLNILRTQENGIFLSYYLNSILKIKIARIAQGDTIVHLYPSQLEKMDVTITSKPEQQRIADCLTSLDELITAQTRKMELLKEHKKGLMQQLFPNLERTAFQIVTHCVTN